MKPTKIEWLDKHQAAKELGMSTRSVLLMASKGEVQSKRGRDPETNQISTWFHAGDIERVRYAREHPEKAVQSAKLPALHTSNGTAQTAMVKALEAIVERVTMPELKEPHFLSLKQARETSGLPASFLRQQFILAGRAIKTGAGWRISRSELERFAQNREKHGPEKMFAGIGTS